MCGGGEKPRGMEWRVSRGGGGGVFDRNVCKVLLSSFVFQTHAAPAIAQAVEAGAVEHGLNLSFKDCSITFYDFGVAVFEATMRIDATREMTLEKLRSLAEALNDSLEAAVSETAKPAIGAFTEAVRLHKKDYGWREMPAAAHYPPEWLHRIFHVPAEEPLEESRVEFDFGNSVIVRRSLDTVLGSGARVALRESVEPALESAYELMNLATAYNAAIWTFDEYLFDQMVRLRALQMSNVRAEKLTDCAEDLFNLYGQVSTFLSIFDHHIARFAPYERRHWHALSQAWQLDENRDVLRNKLRDVRDMYDTEARSRSGEEQRRLNLMVLVLTVLSSFGTIATVTSFLAPVPPDVKSKILAGAAAIALMVIAGVSFVLVPRVKDWLKERR